MNKKIKVSELTIYPVKSLAGISLETSELDDMGLKNDRRWMIVSPEGQFITQRTVPKMALIHPSLDADALTFSMHGMDTHVVPKTTALSKRLSVTVWKDKVDAAMVGEQTNAWLTEALGVSCCLVYIEDNEVRQCDLDFSEKGDRTGFADGFPILVISEESLEDLNQRLEEPVDMRRFRPNVVIKGCEAFAEDKLENFTIGKLAMKAVKICSRCPLPMVDPDVGERTSQEPIATLSTYRKWDGNIFFGMNVIHQQQGVISVGDNLDI